ncbi:thioredoxin family protein [Helicobacter pametensis]|uniref:thioredoxin family protein n=1 Tax=Helicobacter pametensis TaxID=95149 RepID=UPI00047F63EF|nr:thioredoxin family protein [Helicobacter pametensis]
MVEMIDALRYQEVSKSENCLIVFGASWCRDCVRVEPFLKELSEEMDGVLKIYKVDSSIEEELSAALNIRSIPTLIFYRDGLEVGTRIIEPKTKQIIADEIDKNFKS